MTPVRTMRVTGFANGGAGIAHDDEGRVVFVSGALPGEVVRVQIDEQKASFARARAVEIVDASAHRVDPLCPAAAAGAGCCDLSYATPSYAVQLRASALTDVLTRIGGFTPGADGLPAPRVRGLDGSPTRWRVRTRLAVGSDGVPG
ncbi:MAG: TRAM domain-containing protein, partial [Gordonia sp. (in: high G+C Gram-positive bacteria)]|uniref:TRAM domain-containing protein n=1 Tax=Gordonia sp. (in: high G+C Gram-positive bacteria) TaxID=84139 RepID=UPI003BB6F412